MELDDDLLDPEDLDECPVHRTDDPDVWGLSDVARGRTPVVPTTIYAVSGDSASGVEGLLYPTPEWGFVPKAASNVGHSIVLEQDGETFEVMTVWDGAKPCPWFRVYVQETGLETTVRQEHSRGLLLGEYPRQPHVVGRSTGQKTGNVLDIIHNRRHAPASRYSTFAQGIRRDEAA